MMMNNRRKRAESTNPIYPPEEGFKLTSQEAYVRLLRLFHFVLMRVNRQTREDLKHWEAKKKSRERDL